MSTNGDVVEQKEPPTPIVSVDDPEESGSAEDEESERDEDDEDEEEEEPTLKYQRITGAIPDLLKKDSASAVAVCNKLIALGTHAGIVHVLDMTGKRIKSYKPHMATIVDISLDAGTDFVATASMDGQVVVHSLSTPEKYSVDMKRPMRTVAMEPNFAKKGSRAFVCGGLSGALVLREKGWLGHKDTTLYQGEGPIWQVRWRSKLIAWANDNGVGIYDQNSQTRIAYIDRPSDSPRAEVFKCNLHWQDDSTLIIGWADLIKVARIRARARTNDSGSGNLSPLMVEITAVFKLDCMVAGIVPHPTLLPPSAIDGLPESLKPEGSKQRQPQTLTSFLIVAYTPPETFDDMDVVTEDRTRQARKQAERPEMRIISRQGEELAADALSVANYQSWGCNDYAIVEAVPLDDPLVTYAERSYIVMSPRDLVKVMPRDRRDHVEWLVERGQYEQALAAAEEIEAQEKAALLRVPSSIDEPVVEKPHLSAKEIGQRFIEHLVSEGEFVKAAQLCPKVCAQDSKRWEDWIFTFAQKRQLQACNFSIIPYVPTNHPRLDHMVYEMILAHFLTHDRKALLQTIKEWPRDIYDMPAVIIAVRSELDKTTSSSSTISPPSLNSPSSMSGPTTNDTAVLMECLAELYIANRQPGKALPYFLRLRRPNVFDLIKENNLFTDVQDLVLLLVEFDHELMEKAKAKNDGESDKEKANGDVKGRRKPAEEDIKSEAIKLLVDNIHSIPITRVVQQLQQRPYYLFLYLDSLTKKDPHLSSSFADLQVKMYADFAPPRLIDFLRFSSSYDLEAAFEICKAQDLVPEMVFLLGRMGNNKQALTLIIERLGDVHRAIEFAKEQGDDDLWEDLLLYSETRPAFIRGLLENVGPEISPIRLIRRIKNGLEIPGLKEALIKILQDFHLQISLLEGCGEILNGDIGDLGTRLRAAQEGGFLLSMATQCDICSQPLADTPEHSLALLYLCRHVVHATCVPGSERVALPTPSLVSGIGVGSRGINGSIAL
ncbi:vacuolar assembling protein VPS41 [Crepidotus variabilis]|uniref:Vacuolar protein sorting-associated protein 41 n=1 Tax=Crepidotus variabilis TaxID=179855 RepID=A0A9P6ETJ2_9AGAR|nr:vacuolar assembling protein VPS41 [Crepidotus variabilis]